jgi:hypothetical protein
MNNNKLSTHLVLFKRNQATFWTSEVTLLRPLWTAASGTTLLLIIRTATMSQSQTTCINCNAINRTKKEIYVPHK